MHQKNYNQKINSKKANNMLFDLKFLVLIVVKEVVKDIKNIISIWREVWKNRINTKIKKKYDFLNELRENRNTSEWIYKRLFIL